MPPPHGDLRRRESFRARFLRETVADLQQQLKQHNISLIIGQENPAEGIAHWSKELGVTDLYFQKEWTKEEVDRELEVKSANEQLTFHSYYDRFLFHQKMCPRTGEQLPEVFTVFVKSARNTAKCVRVFHH